MPVDGRAEVPDGRAQAPSRGAAQQAGRSGVQNCHLAASGDQERGECEEGWALEQATSFGRHRDPGRKVQVKAANAAWDFDGKLCSNMDKLVAARP